MTQNAKQDLREKWSYRLDRRAKGCFEHRTRLRLLDMKLGEQADNEDMRREYETQFWSDRKYEIRGSFEDATMVCGIADEEMLRSIFSDVDKTTGINPLVRLFESLFPKKGSQITSEEEWRAKLQADIIRMGLQWFIDRKVFRTLAHQRVLLETLDALSVMQSGKSAYKVGNDEFGKQVEQPWDYTPAIGDSSGNREKRKEKQL